jgi:hypothetical protein
MRNYDEQQGSQSGLGSSRIRQPEYSSFRVYRTTLRRTFCRTRTKSRLTSRRGGPTSLGGGPETGRTVASATAPVPSSSIRVDETVLMPGVCGTTTIGGLDCEVSIEFSPGPLQAPITTAQIPIPTSTAPTRMDRKHAYRSAGRIADTVVIHWLKIVALSSGHRWPQRAPAIRSRRASTAVWSPSPRSRKYVRSSRAFPHSCCCSRQSARR